MADPIIKVRDAAGDPFPGAIPFETVVPGVSTAPVTLRIQNNIPSAGAVDTAPNVIGIALARLAGSTADPKAAGIQVLDGRTVEIKVVSNAGGATAPITGFRGLGADSTLDLGSIPDEAEVVVEMRINATALSALADDEVFLSVRSQSSRKMATGLYDTAGNFIEEGLPGGRGRDPSFSQVRSFTGSFTTSGPAGEIVVPTDIDSTVTGIRAIFSGPGTLTFNDEDVNTDALLVGEAYWVLLSLKSDGTMTETKGVKASSPVKPTPPADEILAGAALVPFGLAIVAVETDMILGFFGLTDLGGFAFSIGPGRGTSAESLVSDQTVNLLTAPTNDVADVYRLPTGYELTEQDVLPSDPRALILHRVTTDGVEITGTEDLRQIGVNPDLVGPFLELSVSPAPLSTPGAVRLHAPTGDGRLDLIDEAGVSHIIHVDGHAKIWAFPITRPSIVIGTALEFVQFLVFEVNGRADVPGTLVPDFVTGTILYTGTPATILGQWSASLSASAAGGEYLVLPMAIPATPLVIMGATNATPVVVTTTFGFAKGDLGIISGATGNTAINGSRILVGTSPTEAELYTLDRDPVAGNGVYTGSGQVDTIGSGASPALSDIGSSDFNAFSGDGFGVLAAGDKLGLFVASLSGTMTLTVAQVKLAAEVQGDP